MNINRSVVISTQHQQNSHSFHVSFSKIDHMQGNKRNHNTLKSNKLIHSMCSDPQWSYITNQQQKEM